MNKFTNRAIVQLPATYNVYRQAYTPRISCFWSNTPLHLFFRSTLPRGSEVTNRGEQINSNICLPCAVVLERVNMPHK